MNKGKKWDLSLAQQFGLIYEIKTSLRPYKTWNFKQTEAKDIYVLVCQSRA